MNTTDLRSLVGFLALAGAGLDSACALERPWPGQAPCDTTLNACLAVAQAGDTVRIVASATIPEQIAIGLPVSIETAPGIVATFTSTTTHVFTLPGTAPYAVSLRGLNFVGGSLRFSMNGNLPGEVRLEQLNVVGNASNAQSQVQFNLAQTTVARSLVSIKGCTFVPGSNISASTSIFQFGSSAGGMDFIVEENLFRPEPVAMAQTFHIPLNMLVGGNSAWDVVFRRNQVLPAIGLPSRAYADGIGVNTADNVTVNLLVHDNVFLLDDVAGAGGTAVYAGGSVGQVSARVINNTILHAYYALAFANNVSGRIDNNVMAFGFRLHEGTAPAASFPQRNNLVHSYPIASNWAIAPGTLTSDPLLSAASGLPQIGSPVIDAGSDTARNEAGPGSYGVLTPRDANGLRRIEGAQIDIGAFEGERLFYNGAE